MANLRMTLLDLLNQDEQGADPSFLGDGVRLLAQELMDAEVTQLTGAGLHERGAAARSGPRTHSSASTAKSHGELPHLRTAHVRRSPDGVGGVAGHRLSAKRPFVVRRRRRRRLPPAVWRLLRA